MIFIENNLSEEIKNFEKKYSFEVKIFSDKNLIIPEYKIDLLNKSKKTLKSFENVNNIVEIKKEKLKTNKLNLKTKKTKTKTKKKVRTLWIRKKN